MLWGIERHSPLMDIFRADGSTGFDEYFVAEGRARGINVERAIDGYRKIDDFLAGVRKGNRPRDGVTRCCDDARRRERPYQRRPFAPWPELGVGC